MVTTNNNSISLEKSTQTWPLLHAGLRVRDMSASLDYYSRLGLSIVRNERSQDSEETTGLGFGTHEVLSLRVLAGGRPRPTRTAGLYHFALLVPDEEELGSFLHHCIEHHIPLEGAADHLVSQALYLRDPEGNGIEVYADRPREHWERIGGSIKMDTLPLDAQTLLKQARSFEGFSAQTRLGHMHLNVGDLDRSMAFYQNLGMELMTDLYNQARFLSWEGYHHHLGINLWAGRNAQRMEADMYGLDFFEIAHPTLQPTTLEDPNGVKVIVAAF